DGVLLDKKNPAATLNFGKYEFTVKHSYMTGWDSEAKNNEEDWIPGGAIFIQTNDNEFFIAGSGIVVTFKNLEDSSMKVGILKNENGQLKDGQWIVYRHLNGDQTHQGRHIRIFRNNFMIQRLELYEYEK
ncbi:MAG: DUF5597 domain-containing protein, partial [Bacteroidota bacterium]